MQNTQVITTNDTAEAALAPCRSAVADTITRQYGEVRRYAETITQYFPSDWYMYEHNDKSESAKGILAEAAKFRKTLRDAGHANPSVVWTRVRNEGRKLIEGEPEAASGDGESGEGGGETESAGTKQVRSLSLRLVEDLSALFKACKREEAKNNLDAKQSQAQTHIASALQALGVDLTMVK
jgi:hypothetical protein